MSKRQPPAPLICPSAPAKEGAVLLGVVEEGRVHHLGAPLTIDRSFVAEAAATSPAPLESRFRFASACQQSACSNWEGSRCALSQHVARLGQSNALPDCLIRRSCRWFAQDGPSACRGCVEVVTHLKPENL
jgi:hypothetical protein